MLSKLPIDLDKISTENIDKEILRFGIIAELDAINLYEQFADYTKDPKIKKVMMDIVKEEKEHIGEFQTLLLEKDLEQVKEMERGKKEVEELTKNM